ncbi:MAG TPA: glycosyltransferase, partial [Acidimicrobiales bacterium]|nr:glycosyltransferase [Acidimicrobiales bacterium]
EVRAGVRSALGVSECCVVVTMVGIMRPGKGHAELLAATSRVRTSPDVEMVVVAAGDGPLRTELEASVRVGSRVPIRFVGFWDDVPQLLAASDVVVQPSLVDALPTSLIHALAAGVPAIASDVGGIPEIVTPDTGILVPPGDVDALAAAISQLAAEPGARRRMGAAALRRFDAEFDAERWMGRLRALYDEVLEETARP